MDELLKMQVKGSRMKQLISYFASFNICKTITDAQQQDR